VEIGRRRRTGCTGDDLSGYFVCREGRSGWTGLLMMYDLTGCGCGCLRVKETGLSCYASRRGDEAGG
jgi:hypothetical protein